MSKYPRIEIPDTDVRDHPSVKAWSTLRSDEVVPSRIDVLYWEEKTQVYRLRDLGPSKTDVIAKRCVRDTALLERKVYDEILPSLPVSSLECYGYADDDHAFSWLFLEDAGAELYSPLLKEDRMLAARWLAALHLSAAPLHELTILPDRGADFYGEQLRRAHDEILRGFSNPTLAAEDVRVLRAMIPKLELLERRWDQVTEVCACVPPTLVHGDLVLKNVRVGRRQHERALLVMDWEFVGWGVPAVDLTQCGFGDKTVGPDLEGYLSMVRVSWPHLNAGDLLRLADAGRIFRFVAIIKWCTTSLSTPYFDDEIEDLQKFQMRLAAFIESAGWA